MNASYGFEEEEEDDEDGEEGEIRDWDVAESNRESERYIKEERSTNFQKSPVVLEN